MSNNRKKFSSVDPIYAAMTAGLPIDAPLADIEQRKRDRQAMRLDGNRPGDGSFEPVKGSGKHPSDKGKRRKRNKNPGQRKPTKRERQRKGNT